jgi:cysteine desulfurase family protein (TIGR01976 family)
MAAIMSDGRFANDAGFFPASAACDEILAQARTSVARLLGGRADEIVFNTSTTANLFNLTRSLAIQWRPGDVVVCTELDHDANIAPWLAAAKDAGARVEIARVDPKTCRIDLDHLDSLLGPRTRWLAISASSNATGTATDLGPIIALAHERSIRVLVDAVAYVPHREVDVAALGCDALVTSPYKWYGPHAGVLWLSSALMEELPAYQIRAGHTHGPERFEHGTPPYEVLAGIGAAAEFLLDVGMPALRDHEERLLGHLLSGLADVPGVRIYGEPTVGEHRTPTVAFRVEGRHPDEVCRALAEDQIAAWSGDFYAMELVRALGLRESGGLVRLGLAAYTQLEEIDRVVKAVSRIAGA